MNKIIAGNWKMNLLAEQATVLLDKIQHKTGTVTRSDVIVFPQAIQIGAALTKLQNTSAMVGCQNISEHLSGAYTGEISAATAVSYGCDFALIGHSERRMVYGETDDSCAKKLQTAIGQNLGVIYCIGEELEVREAGRQNEEVGEQLNYFCNALIGAPATARVHIAYEPVWAIGTGKTATVDQVTAMHVFIREQLAQRSGIVSADHIAVLYGGSVKKNNAHELLQQPTINGLLIGGASITDDFIDIITISEEI